jgi:hypothetical protein
MAKMIDISREVVRLSADDAASILTLALPQLLRRCPAVGDQRDVATEFLGRLIRTTRLSISIPVVLAGKGLTKLFEPELELLGTTTDKIRQANEERKRVEGNLHAVVSYLRDAGPARVSYQLQEYLVELVIPRPGRGAGKKEWKVSFSLGFTPQDAIYEEAAEDAEIAAFYSTITAAHVKKYVALDALPSELGAWCQQHLDAGNHQYVVWTLSFMLSEFSFTERVVFLNKVFGFNTHTEVISPTSFDYCYLQCAAATWCADHADEGTPDFLEDIEFLPRLAATEALMIVPKCLILRALIDDEDMGDLDTCLGPRPMLHAGAILFDAVSRLTLSELVSEHYPNLPEFMALCDKEFKKPG